MVHWVVRLYLVWAVIAAAGVVLAVATGAAGAVTAKRPPPFPLRPVQSYAEYLRYNASAKWRDGVAPATRPTEYAFWLFVAFVLLPLMPFVLLYVGISALLHGQDRPAPRRTP